MNTINPGFSPIPYNLLPSAEPDCQSKALALPAESKESAELETPSDKTEISLSEEAGESETQLKSKFESLKSKANSFISDVSDLAGEAKGKVSPYVKDAKTFTSKNALEFTKDVAKGIAKSVCEEVAEAISFGYYAYKSVKSALGFSKGKAAANVEKQASETMGLVSGACNIAGMFIPGFSTAGTAIGGAKRELAKAVKKGEITAEEAQYAVNHSVGAPIAGATKLAGKIEDMIETKKGGAKALPFEEKTAETENTATLKSSGKAFAISTGAAIGAATGAAAGSTAGAIAGAAIAGPVGAVIGAAVGKLATRTIAESIGGKIGAKIGDKINSNNQEQTKTDQKPAEIKADASNASEIKAE